MRLSGKYLEEEEFVDVEEGEVSNNGSKGSDVEVVVERGLRLPLEADLSINSPP